MKMRLRVNKDKSITLSDGRKGTEEYQTVDFIKSGDELTIREEDYGGGWTMTFSFNQFKDILNTLESLTRR